MIRKMIKTIIGIILILIPFLLMYKFKDKVNGFYSILAILIGFHLIVAIVTQMFGIFSYLVVFNINLILGLIILSKVEFRKLLESVRKIKVDWIFVIVLVIVFISLFQVHYSYTGAVNTVNGEINVENMKYVYPYFSDEWATISLIQYSINSGKLPLVKTFWYEEKIVNFIFPFHSFASELILFFDLNPLTQFIMFHIVFGLIICSLVYFILLKNGIEKIASAIAAISILYIVNGSHITGIWFFLQNIMGIVFLLLICLFVTMRKDFMVILSSVFCAIFYPPIILFQLLIVFGYFLFNREDVGKKYVKYYIGIIVLVSLIFSFFVLVFNDWNFFNAIGKIWFKIYHITLSGNAIFDFRLGNVIPYVVLVFAVLGLFSFIGNFKKRMWLILPLIYGGIFWMYYYNNLMRVLITFNKLVYVTSILLVLLSGFGINYFINIINRRSIIKKFMVIEILGIIVLVILLFFSFSYTENMKWEDINLRVVTNGIILRVESPANNHLNQGDLELFSGINKARFLSTPWKGLVIASATGNYPLVTKASTLTNIVMDSSIFIRENCVNKLKIAKKEKMEYVYLNKIDCPGFDLVGVSSEGLYLYKINLEN